MPLNYISQPLGYISDCHNWVMLLIAEISSAAQYLTKPRIGHIYNKAMTVVLWWRKNNLNEKCSTKNTTCLMIDLHHISEKAKPNVSSLGL